jgi:hypothetical protein
MSRRPASGLVPGTQYEVAQFMNQEIGAGVRPLIEGANNRIVFATKARIEKCSVKKILRSGGRPLLVVKWLAATAEQ